MRSWSRPTLVRAAGLTELTITTTVTKDTLDGDRVPHIYLDVPNVLASINSSCFFSFPSSRCCSKTGRGPHLLAEWLCMDFSAALLLGGWRSDATHDHHLLEIWLRIPGQFSPSCNHTSDWPLLQVTHSAISLTRALKCQISMQIPTVHGSLCKMSNWSVWSNDFVPHQNSNGGFEVEPGWSSWGSCWNWQDWNHKRSGKSFG